MATRKIQRRRMTAEEELTNIYMSMRMVTLTKNQAVAIVGSRSTLERLVYQEKKIRKVQTHHKQNSQWKCNGEDVLRWAKDYMGE